MNKIIYDNEIIIKSSNNYEYFEYFIKKLNKIDCLKLALFCAKYVNPNIKETNYCIKLVEQCLIGENIPSEKKLIKAAEIAFSTTNNDYFFNSSMYVVTDAVYVAKSIYKFKDVYFNAYISYAISAIKTVCNIIINNKASKYLQILLRKTKQFQNNKILEQISKTDVDTLELVDWNMITDIMLEEYNIIHEFEYSDVFSRRCLIELLRREYA